MFGGSGVTAGTGATRGGEGQGGSGRLTVGWADVLAGDADDGSARERGRKSEEALGAVYAAAREAAERIRADARAEADRILADAESAAGRTRRMAASSGPSLPDGRHHVAVAGVLALFGLLVGAVVGLLVHGALATTTTSRLYGITCAVIGLGTGLFVGAVVGSAGGAALGRFSVIGDALAGLVGCGGLIGLAVGSLAGGRPEGSWADMALAAGVGTLLGCAIGLIIYGGQLVRQFAQAPQDREREFHD